MGVVGLGSLHGEQEGEEPPREVEVQGGRWYPGIREVGVVAEKPKEQAEVVVVVQNCLALGVGVEGVEGAHPPQRTRGVVVVRGVLAASWALQRQGGRVEGEGEQGKMTEGVEQVVEVVVVP